MDMHMDRSYETFWIKSKNGTFIALQMKSFGSKNFQISSTGKKVSSWQFFRMDWNDRALSGWPSRLPHRNWKIIFVSIMRFCYSVHCSASWCIMVNLRCSLHLVNKISKIEITQKYFQYNPPNSTNVQKNVQR